MTSARVQEAPPAGQDDDELAGRALQAKVGAEAGGQAGSASELQATGGQVSQAPGRRLWPIHFALGLGVLLLRACLALFSRFLFGKAEQQEGAAVAQLQQQQAAPERALASRARQRSIGNKKASKIFANR